MQQGNRSTDHLSLTVSQDGVSLTLSFEPFSVTAAAHRGVSSDDVRDLSPGSLDSRILARHSMLEAQPLLLLAHSELLLVLQNALDDLLELDDLPILEELEPLSQALKRFRAETTALREKRTAELRRRTPKLRRRLAPHKPKPRRTA
jgi:hypothetical protein